MAAVFGLIVTRAAKYKVMGSTLKLWSFLPHSGVPKPKSIISTCIFLQLLKRQYIIDKALSKSAVDFHWL